MRPLACLALALSLGCGSSEPTIADETAPTLEVRTPERGSFVEGDFVVVTGVISDDTEVGSVVVNGVEAEVAADGSFSAMVSLEPGVTILRTTATDAAGNETPEARGVLAGQLVPHGTQIKDALVAELKPSAFTSLAAVAADQLGALDYQAVGAAVSPIVDRGNSCFGVEVDLRDVQFSSLAIGLSPTDGALSFTMTATDLDVEMRANWELTCIGGGAGVNISADEFTVVGELSLDLISGRVTAELTESAASFVGFDLDVGAIPDSIVNFFVNDIDEKVAGAILGQFESLVPPMIEDALGALAGQTPTVSLFDTDIDLDVTPTEFAISPEGARLALDFAATSEAIPDTTYISTPQPAPTSAELPASFNVAVADDVANQLIGLLWFARALDAQLDIGATPLREIFPTADTVALELSMPPAVTTDLESRQASVGIAELVITARAGDSDVAKLSLAGHVKVGVGTVNGGTRLSAEVSDLTTSVVFGSGELGLRPDQIQILADVGISEIRKRLNNTLQTLVIPGIGAEIQSPELATTRGYLLVSAELSPGADN